MRSILVLILLISAFNLFAQETEFEKHLKSLRDLPYRAPSPNSRIKDTTFIDFALRQIIKPEDKIYVSNRRLLKEFNLTSCSEWYAEMSTLTAIDSLKIRIEIVAREFNPVQRKIEKFQQEEYKDYIEKIDNQIAHGAVYGIPNFEIEDLKISIEGKEIEIPDSAYKNLFDPNFCEFHGFVRRVSAYTSLDSKFIYIYIYGGEAADTYFSKLIFDREKFIAKWVVGYGPLSVFGCFSDRFVGF